MKYYSIIKLLSFVLILLMITFSSFYAQTITIDGDMSDWNASMLFDVPPNQTEDAGDFTITPNIDLKDIYITHDDTFLYIRVDINDDGDLTNMAEYPDNEGNWKDLIQIYFDVDQSIETGLSYNWLTGGDFYLNITDPYGNPGLKTTQKYGILKHVGINEEDEKWDELIGDSCLVAIDLITKTSIEIAVPRYLIGETNGNDEKTNILIRSETPSAWATDDVAPNNPNTYINTYNYWAPTGPAIITKDPVSKLKYVGETALFTVIAKGESPFTYQWYLGGAIISGAENAEYITPELMLSDSGNTYYCIVNNNLGSASSKSATLEVKELSKDDDLLHPEWGFTDFAANSEYLVTDLSLANIQKAINDASAAGGGSVILSAGTVTINNRINMKSNVKLKGVLNSDSTRAVTIIASGRFNEGLIYANTSVSNTTIENLVLDVNNYHMHCIAYVYGPDNFLVNNNIIKNVGTPKINTVSGPNDVPSYMDNPTGVNMWSDGDFAEGFTISNNIIDGVAKHGIDVNYGRSFILKNNYIRNAFMGFDASTGSQYAEILGNETYGCVFGAKIIGSSSNDVIMHNNNLHHCDPAPYYWGGEWGYDSGTALVLQMPGTNIVVHNNILSGATIEKGIAFWDGGYGDLKNNDFTPSTFIPESQPPQINVQPKSQIKTVGLKATFNVEAKGTTPFTYKWYVNGIIVNGAESNEYTTPTLYENNNGDKYFCIVSNNLGSDTSSIAVLTVNPAGSGIMHGGKIDKGTAGEGDYYPWECSGGACKRGLVFDANADFVLKSVKVYNGESGEGSYNGIRTISVIDTEGNIVAKKTVDIVAGEQILELNMSIPIGDNYKILADVHKGFWRDNAVTFPYAIGSYGVIKSGTDSLWSDAGRDGYYFFYDWVVKDTTLTDINDINTRIPTSYSLEQNYPNPFNPSTTISYSLPKASNVTITIYNALGQEVAMFAKGMQSAGNYSVAWNAQFLASGLYIYRLNAGNFIQVKKMVLMK